MLFYITYTLVFYNTQIYKQNFPLVHYFFVDFLIYYLLEINVFVDITFNYV